MELTTSTNNFNNAKYETYKNVSNTSFKGIPVSKIKLKDMPVSDEIVIFKVGVDDIPFLEKMLEKLNLSDLYPNVPQAGFSEWKNIIEGAILNIKNKTTGLLGIMNKKPCAIASYSQTNGNSQIYIDHIAAWPSSPGAGTKGAGTALMRQIFDTAQITGANKVFLVPDEFVARGKKCSDFYDKVGFSTDSSGYIKEIKTNSNPNVFSKLNDKIDEDFQFVKIDEKNDVSLDTVAEI